MRPPICAVCGNRFSTSEGGLVSFALTDEEKEENKRFEQPGFVGHPRGLEWFCGKHVDKAREFSHLTLSEALSKIMKSSA